ncbi:hypothetical protein KGY77_05935 [Candidatus Bipolaricaulota bacterium]|nr:hypothetical protein [Candidatus Bipolaricaulota bacterium]MBS3792167.1 hypothetical protein [Candidatus Bipolaricaulota bacterium]
MSESVIVRSHLKEKIKNRTDLRSREEAVDNLMSILDEVAVKLVDASGDAAREDDRKTVLRRDVVKAERVVLEETAPEVEEIVDLIASLTAEDMLKLAEAIRAKRDQEKE